MIARFGRFPGGEHAIHSSILAWRIPWTEERGYRGYSPWGRIESDMTKQLSTAPHSTGLSKEDL